MVVPAWDTWLGLLFVCWTVLIFAEESKPKAKRYVDKSFPKYNFIFGKNVSCGQKGGDGLYPSFTWTCADVRVNGARLAYGYYPGMGVSTKCMDTKGQHEFAELCREMLRSIDVHKPLWAAYVPGASCDRIREKRAVLNRTKTGYSWSVMHPGNGWVRHIQCMIRL